MTSIYRLTRRGHFCFLLHFYRSLPTLTPTAIPRICRCYLSRPSCWLLPLQDEVVVVPVLPAGLHLHRPVRGPQTPLVPRRPAHLQKVRSAAGQVRSGLVRTSGHNIRSGQISSSALVSRSAGQVMTGRDNRSNQVWSASQTRSAGQIRSAGRVMSAGVHEDEVSDEHVPTTLYWREQGCIIGELVS